jgi:Spx/MgsR family transcriptional regulator
MSAAVTLYGIANCDSIRKARAWLGDHGIDHVFHDYRKQGATRQLLQSMAAQLGWEVMLNRRGTTWRALPEETRAQLDERGALQLMQTNPAIIKRPILAKNDRLYIGFSAQQYQEIFD